MAQGSVLGPLIFVLYSSPLYRIALLFFLLSHFFSDDSQFYKRFSIRDEAACRGICMVMAECIAETKGWTEANKMKLNIPKTDVLIAQNSSIQLELPVDVGDVTITPSKAVRNLGVIIDSNLSLEPHVSNLCKRAFYHIRRISQIRRFLDKDTTARLVSAFVTSTLDNGNSILYGLPKKISRSTAKCSKCCGVSSTGRNAGSISHHKSKSSTGYRSLLASISKSQHLATAV